MPRRPINSQYAPGIGRPIRADWSTTVGNVLAHNLPEQTRLRMRKKPGITYVSGQELLTREIIPYHGSYDDMALVIEKLVADTLATLGEDGKVDSETARQQYTDLPFRPATKEVERKYFVLRAGVLDPESDFYECGKQFAGERIAFRRELGVPLDPGEQSPAENRMIPLAMIGDISSVALGATLRRVMGAIPPVPIGEIGVVRPDNV